jgi:hypothetical protein
MNEEESDRLKRRAARRGWSGVTLGVILLVACGGMFVWFIFFVLTEIAKGIGG